MISSYVNIFYYTLNSCLSQQLFSVYGEAMLVYKINVQQKLKEAGYSSYRLRQERLLSESTVQKMRVGDMGLSFSTLNVICNILQCQPGDILEWVPDPNAPGAPPCDTAGSADNIVK